MKRLTASVLGLVMTCGVASADPDVQGQQLSPDDPGLLSPLSKGQPAPFPGVLFSPRAAASVVTDVSTVKDKIKIEVDSAVKAVESKKDFAFNELNTTCAADKARASASLEANVKRIALLEKDLQEAKKSAPNRGLWFGLGAAGGVVVSILVTITVVQLTK